MAGQVVPFQDIYNQKEEIRRLQAARFWYSQVHNETWHMFGPNQWIYHKNQDPYKCEPPTPGYARWYPTSSHTYAWIDFPNPDYPTMGNEEGRKLTHPDGVPDQWEHNPVVTGDAAGRGAPAVNPNPAAAAGRPSGGKGGKGQADGGQAQGPTWANVVAGGPPPKGKAGKGKPAPAPNTAAGKAGPAKLTAAVPAAAGALATAGTILPAGGGGTPVGQGLKRPADIQLTRGDQSPRAPSDVTDISMSASSVIVNYVSEQKGESRRMLNAIGVASFAGLDATSFMAFSTWRLPM